MELLGGIRPSVGFYTDKASDFQTAAKRKRDEPGVDKDAMEMPSTQIARALRELEITWIAAHSPQAKGRVERNFGTAQDGLVKGVLAAGVKTIEEANEYLIHDYLPWRERELTVLAGGTLSGTVFAGRGVRGRKEAESRRARPADPKTACRSTG